MVKEFLGKKIAILGFALEGQSTLAFLRRQGVRDDQITLLDQRPLENIPPTLQVYTGEHYLETIETYDLIFKAPGMTRHMLQQRLGKDDLDRSRFTSQTQWFFDHYQGTTIGVTGTKGKSTTVSLLYEMLQQAGKNVILAGNVGQPILDLIDFDQPPEIIIYELSSFMLDALDQFTVDIGIFTSLYPTHTQEHGGYQAYAEAKYKLFHHARHLLIGSQLQEIADQDMSLQTLLQEKSPLRYGKKGTYTFTEGRFYKDSQSLFTDEGMKILGLHNRYNACALLGVCDLLNIDVTFAQQALISFPGLEHRIEYVGTYEEIDRYNDAIATTPQATIAAIETFGDRLGTIFLGGIEGDYEFEELVTTLEKYHVPNIILFPDTGSRIKALLDLTQHTLLETRSMEEAVRFAYQHTPAGKVALLSCGSPSFSLWTSFKEKGAQFKAAIQQGIKN